MSAIWEVAERVQALTGKVPNQDDNFKMLFGSGILVIQRHPKKLSKYRVCLLCPDRLDKLPQLVAEKWT